MDKLYQKIVTYLIPDLAGDENKGITFKPSFCVIVANLIVPLSDNPWYRVTVSFGHKFTDFKFSRIEPYKIYKTFSHLNTLYQSYKACTKLFSIKNPWEIKKWHVGYRAILGNFKKREFVHERSSVIFLHFL